MVLALQTIVSRNVSPFHPLVLSITEMHGGHVWNVVPDKASFQGTVRYFHKSDGELVEKRFKQQVQSIAAGYGITADIDWDDFQNPLVSDTELSKIVADNVRDYAQLEPIHRRWRGRTSAISCPSPCRCSPSSVPTARKAARIGTARISSVLTNRCKPRGILRQRGADGAQRTVVTSRAERRNRNFHNRKKHNISNKSTVS